MKRYCGRAFSPDDLQAIVRTIELNPTVRRTPLSRLVCEQLNWRRPDGRLREMSCRVAMLRMQADGLITLPASLISKPRRRARFIATPATDEQPLLLAAVHELPALKLSIARRARNALQAVERVRRALPLPGLHADVGQPDPLQRACG